MNEKTNIDDMILALKRDKDFQELIEKYTEPNCFSIMGRTRLEEWHSNFMKWLFDKNESHNLQTFAIEKLLELVNNKLMPSERIIVENANLSTLRMETEKPIEFQQRKGRIDIFGESESLIIVIENKVNSKEEKIKGEEWYQTDLYYYFCEKNFKEKQRCYIYLNPYLYNKPNNDNYIVITYQEIFDYIIEDCMKHPNINFKAKPVLKQYAVNLSTSDCSGRNYIAFTEKELANKIYSKHKTIIKHIIDEMKDINRDKNSNICKFYKKYARYINLILGSLKMDIIIPRNEMSLKGQNLLIELCNRGYINLDDTKLVTERNKATYTLKICKRDGKYYCYGGYSTVKKNVNSVINIETGDEYFSTIGKAASAIQDAHDIYEIGEKRSSNSGPSAGQWHIVNAKDESIENRTIGELGL